MCIRDRRISVTDRCNFRCSYCMPKEVFDKAYKFLPHDSLLSFEEITRTARLFVAHGVGKLRLTGGEPLLRKNLEVLVDQLAALRTPAGEALDITLTTNGSVLERKAQALRAAGLKRVTVSLDALDDAVFRRMNDVDFPVADVLRGIAAALRTGMAPVKVNMVVKRGTNDHEIVPLARHVRDAYGPGVILRFIEYMDVGATNGWCMDEVLPSAEVGQRLSHGCPLETPQPHAPGQTAGRGRHLGGRHRHRVLLGVGQHARERAGQDCFFHHVSGLFSSSISTSRAPDSTWSPAWACTTVTRPAACADSHISIFMASTQTLSLIHI